MEFVLRDGSKPGREIGDPARRDGVRGEKARNFARMKPQPDVRYLLRVRHDRTGQIPGLAGNHDRPNRALRAMADAKVRRAGFDSQLVGNFKAEFRYWKMSSGEKLHG